MNNYKAKIIVFAALFAFFTFVVESAFASGTTTASLGYQVCSIRWLFCGGVRATICAVAIIIVGFMVLAGRMTWGTALVILCGMLLFANAEFFALMFTANPRCFCAPITVPVVPVTF